MTPAPARNAPSAQVLLLAMIAIWGASYVAVKDAIAYLQPFAVIAARFWIGVLCLLPFALRAGRAQLLAALRPGVVTGFVLAVGYATQTYGMQETRASTGGFMAGLIPLLVAAGGFLFFGEPMRRNSLLGLAAGCTGIVLLCLGGDDDGKTDTRFGIGMQLLSSTCYAVHILLISRLGARTQPMAFCLWQLVTVALVAAAAMPLTGGIILLENPHAFDFVLLIDVLYLGLLATALGIGVQSSVQPRIPPTQVALLFATQPGFAAAAGWILRGERLGVLHWLGGAAIVLGIVIAARPPRA